MDKSVKIKVDYFLNCILDEISSSKREIDNGLGTFYVEHKLLNISEIVSKIKETLDIEM